MLLALRANPGDLYHRMVNRKPKHIGLREQRCIAVFKFGYSFAIPAYQELRRTLMTWMNTTDECITTFDAVYKALRQQEFERAIHNRWRYAFAASNSIQFGQDIVGTERLVANQQDFENLSTSRGQA